MTDETDYNMYRFFTDFMVDKEFTEPEEIAVYIQDMLHDMLMDGYPFSAVNIELVEENV